MGRVRAGGVGGRVFWLVVSGLHLPPILILSAAVKLSCIYSGFSSPRVEWKFVQGSTTALVCYNNQITGNLSLHLLRTAWIPGVGASPGAQGSEYCPPFSGGQRMYLGGHVHLSSPADPVSSTSAPISRQFPMQTESPSHPVASPSAL